MILRLKPGCGFFRATHQPSRRGGWREQTVFFAGREGDSDPENIQAADRAGRRGKHGLFSSAGSWPPRFFARIVHGKNAFRLDG